MRLYLLGLLACGSAGAPEVRERAPSASQDSTALPSSSGATDSAPLPAVATVGVSPDVLHAGEVEEALTVEVTVPVTLRGAGLPEWLERAQADRSVLQVELPVIGVEIEDEGARSATTFAPPRFCRVGGPCEARDGLWRAWHISEGAIVAELQLALGWADRSKGIAVRNTVGVWLPEQATLPAGDTIRLVYTGPVPDRATWTGRPLLPRARWREAVREDCPAAERACWVEADPAAVEGWQVAAAAPAFVHLKAPLDAVVGETDDLVLVVTDRFGNPSPWTGQLTLSGPLDAVVPLEDAWRATVAHTWSTPGPTSVQVDAGESLRATTHWTVVHPEEPGFRRRLGDTHLHTGDGGAQRAFLGHFEAGDHAGLFTASADAFRYLEEVAGLDFGAVSEHALRIDGALTPPGVDTDPAFLPGGACLGAIDPVPGIEGWWTTSQEAARDASSSAFIAFPAFEWQSHHSRPDDRTLNHRVVLFRDHHPDRAHPLLPGDTPGLSPKCLIRFLRAAGYGPEDALVLPHMQVAGDRNLDWELSWGPWSEDLLDVATVESYTPIAEIFSARSYADTPEGRLPRAFLFEGDAVAPAPYAFRSGWRDWSAHVGVIGSSDNHTAAPGLDDPPDQEGWRNPTSEPGGLAVALVSQEGRDGLWEAFRARRTYATTGHRGWLDLRVGGAPMGSAIAADTPSLEVTLEAHVGLELTQVEVWTARLGDPDWPWTAPYAVSPGGQSYTGAFTLPNPVDLGAAPGEWAYYLRVLARWGDEPLEEAEAMWSSPIWVRWSASTEHSG